VGEPILEREREARDFLIDGVELKSSPLKKILPNSERLVAFLVMA
jgi:hypothetical protein